MQKRGGIVVISDTRSYLNGPNLDEALATVTDETTHTHIRDRVGSVCGLITATSTLFLRQFTPYGNLSHGNLDNNSIGFAGRQFDGTGLYYMRHRYYTPEDGIFLSRDPLSPQQHAYLYAAANPLSFSDPLGTTIRKIYGPKAHRYPQLLSVLKRSPFGHRLWKALHKSDKILLDVIVSGSTDSQFPQNAGQTHFHGEACYKGLKYKHSSTSVVYFNPFHRSRMTEAWRRNAPPNLAFAVTLGHEFAHAFWQVLDCEPENSIPKRVSRRIIREFKNDPFLAKYIYP